MLRFVINKELDVTRRQLVNYLIGYTSQYNVTLPPYEEKPFALSAYATEKVLPSCAKNAKQINAADVRFQRATNTTCANNTLNNNINDTNPNTAAAADSALHNTYSNIAAGRVYCIRKWDEVEIDLLASNPNHRVHGTGTALMSHVEHIAEQNNCHHMTLMTLEFQARPFYERLGFRLITEQKEFAGKSKAYHLTKTLVIPQSKCVSMNKSKVYGNIRVEEDDNLDAVQNDLVNWLQLFGKENGAHDIPPFDRTKYAIYAVAHDSKTCVGGALFETWWGNMTVEMFVINPLERHKGYGTQLIHELTRFAYAQHSRRITVYATDVTVKKLLSSHGFMQIGKQHDIPYPLQRYWMEKML